MRKLILYFKSLGFDKLDLEYHQDGIAITVYVYSNIKGIMKHRFVITNEILELTDETVFNTYIDDTFKKLKKNMQ